MTKHAHINTHTTHTSHTHTLQCKPEHIACLESSLVTYKLTKQRAVQQCGAVTVVPMLSEKYVG